MEAVPSEPECRCSLDAPVGLGCRWRRRRDGGGTKSAFTVIKFRSVVVVATAAKSYDKKRKITHSGYEWRRGDERWSGIQFFCQWVRVCSFVHRSLSSHSSLPCLSFPHFSFFRFFFSLNVFPHTYILLVFECFLILLSLQKHGPSPQTPSFIPSRRGAIHHPTISYACLVELDHVLFESDGPLKDDLSRVEQWECRISA
jgi:hypothetical protein